MFAWNAELAALAPPLPGERPTLEVRQMGRVRLFRSALKARAAGYEPRESLVRLMQTGEGDLDDEADAFLLAVNAPRRGTGIGKISGLSEDEARKVAVAAIDRIVGLRGIGDAVDVVSRIGLWKPHPLFPVETARFLAAARLREWLAHVGDASYEAGLRRAQRLDRAYETLAYLFPALFDRAIEQLQGRSTLMLGAISRRHDYERLAPQLGDIDMDRNALHLARTLREDALPILLAADRRSLGVARALTAFVSPEAAGALARCEHRAAGAIVRDYLSRHPELVQMKYAGE